MVTTRRQSLGGSTPPPSDEEPLGTPPHSGAGRQLKSAHKMRPDPQFGDANGGQATPQGAGIARRVRINSGDNMVHIFQASAATAEDCEGDAADDGGAVSTQRRRRARGAPLVLPRGAQAVLMLLAWSAVSSFLIFYNKHIMVSRTPAFPFPLLLPALSQLGCAALAWAAGAAGVAPVRPMPPPRVVLSRLLPLAACFVMCLSLGNYAYLGLSVAFLNILKAFTPAVTLLISAAAGMEKLTLAALLSTLVIAYGTGIATVSEAATNLSFHWPSCIAFTTSILFEGTRVVLSARLLGG
jgi:hypothetical protein